VIAHSATAIISSVTVLPGTSTPLTIVLKAAASAVTAKTFATQVSNQNDDDIWRVRHGSFFAAERESTVVSNNEPCTNTTPNESFANGCFKLRNDDDPVRRP
jgi:hypothetical protein